VTRSSRLSRAAILTELKLAARKGDRVALTLAIEQMKLWALSPRYWEKYLDLLGHPLARLIDMTVIKQGEKIARQKGWVTTRRERTEPTRGAKTPAARSARATPARSAAADQVSLFPDQG
jgi:hypothetical protein